MKQTLSALKPRLLIHPTLGQLQEIYDLRVTDWATNHLIDTSRFPTGLFDAFDEWSHHYWVVSHEERYIAAARLTIGRQLSALPDHNVVNRIFLSVVTPVALLSRLVIHPDFRAQGFAQALDDQRLRYVDARMIPLTLAYAAPKRTAQLLRNGFVVAGSPNVQYLSLTGDEGECVLSRQKVPSQTNRLSKSA